MHPAWIELTAETRQGSEVRLLELDNWRGGAESMAPRFRTAEVARNKGAKSFSVRDKVLTAVVLGAIVSALCNRAELDEGFRLASEKGRRSSMCPAVLLPPYQKDGYTSPAELLPSWPGLV